MLAEGVGQSPLLAGNGSQQSGIASGYGVKHTHRGKFPGNVSELEQGRMHDANGPEIIDERRLGAEPAVAVVNHVPAFLAVQEVFPGDAFFTPEVGEDLMEYFGRYRCAGLELFVEISLCLEGLTVTPAANSNEDFSLTITANSTESDGSTATTSSTLSVAVTGDADAPTLSVTLGEGTTSTGGTGGTGGEGGGTVVFEDTPEEIITHKNSYTGKFLKAELER